MNYETKLLKPDEAGVTLAVSLLRAGELVGMPTETVYGLAADALNPQAAAKIYAAKGRPSDNPLIVHIADLAMLEPLTTYRPKLAYTLAEAFWPGPLTMILHGNRTLPSIVPAGGGTQGVRCPNHSDTLAVIRALGRPLACPSANLSGQPSPKSAADVFCQLAGRIDAVLDGGACAVGVESTIVDMTAEPYRILRQGGLSREAIETALGKKLADN